MPEMNPEDLAATLAAAEHAPPIETEEMEDVGEESPIPAVEEDVPEEVADESVGDDGLPANLTGKSPREVYEIMAARANYAGTASREAAAARKELDEFRAQLEAVTQQITTPPPVENPVTDQDILTQIATQRANELYAEAVQDGEVPADYNPEDPDCVTAWRRYQRQAMREAPLTLRVLKAEQAAARAVAPGVLQEAITHAIQAEGADVTVAEVLATITDPLSAYQLLQQQPVDTMQGLGLLVARVERNKLKAQMTHPVVPGARKAPVQPTQVTPSSQRAPQTPSVQKNDPRLPMAEKEVLKRNPYFAGQLAKATREKDDARLKELHTKVRELAADYLGK